MERPRSESRERSVKASETLHMPLCLQMQSDIPDWYRCLLNHICGKYLVHQSRIRVQIDERMLIIEGQAAIRGQGAKHRTALHIVPVDDEISGFLVVPIPASMKNRTTASSGPINFFLR